VTNEQKQAKDNTNFDEG